jgi:diacylglycerol kinase (ATP)
MRKLISATRNSARGWRFLMREETAFRLEVLLLALSAPAAWFLSSTPHGFVLLIGAVLAMMIAEAVNTAIEAACDAYSREFNADIRHAKDCASLAVALTIVIAATIWGLAVWDRFFAA